MSLDQLKTLVTLLANSKSLCILIPWHTHSQMMGNLKALVYVANKLKPYANLNVDH